MRKRKLKIFLTPKRFIQDDIKELTDELAKREAALRRMEDTQSENQYLIHELNGMKKRLLSFEEFAKDAQPEALFTLVHLKWSRVISVYSGVLRRGRRANRYRKHSRKKKVCIE